VGGGAFTGRRGTAGSWAHPPMIVGRAANAQVFKAAGVTPPEPTHTAGERGQHYPLSWTRNPRFARSLEEAVARHIGAEWELGHGGFERFLGYVRESFRLLKDEAVTPSALLGQVIERILPQLKEVRHIAVTINHMLLRLANAAVTARTDVFVNGAGKPVAVTRPFTGTTMIRDVWIRVGGQPKGSRYFDHGCLFTNDAGQSLPGRHEYKSRAAGLRKIRKQVTAMDPRIMEYAGVEGAELHYRVIDPVTGAETFGSTPLADLVLMPDAAGPFSRMGVRADHKFRVTEAKDKRGKPYILVSAAVNSRGIRLALEVMLRDKSWQRPGWSTR
jgi:hypothetical protein